MDTAEFDESMDDSGISDPPGQLQGGIHSTRGRRSREAMDSSQDVAGWSRQKLETVCKAHSIKGYSGKKREWMLQRVQAVLHVMYSFVEFRPECMKVSQIASMRLSTERCRECDRSKPVGWRTSTSGRRSCSCDLSYESSRSVACQPKVRELCTASLEHNVSRHVRYGDPGLGEQIDARPIRYRQRWF